MKSNRVNTTLTFSAALIGLALIVLTPSAQGHGNNPSFSDTKPTTGTTPPGPPGANPSTDLFGGPGQESPQLLESIVDPGIVIGIDVTLNDSFDVLSQVVSEPMTIDLTSHAIEPLDEVVIVGTVGPRPTEEVFVIHASKLHRVSG